MPSESPFPNNQPPEQKPNLKELPDSELIKLFQSGNERAFTAIFNKYQADVEELIIRYVTDKATAKDITQEIFLKVYDNLKAKKYAEEEKFPNWLMKISKNKLIDYTRKGKSTKYIRMLLPEQTDDDEFGQVSIKDVSDQNENPEDLLIKKYDYEVLTKLFDKIPPEQARTVKHKFETGESFEEMAKSEGVSESTVKTRYYSGLVKMKELIKKNKSQQ